MSEMVTGGINFGTMDNLNVLPNVEPKIEPRWIPVSERLPDEPLEGIHDFYDLPEYLVTIEGATVATVLTYCGNGEWWRDGNFYNVVAWMPLPDAYREGET